MDKNQKIGGKTVVFILKGTPSKFQVEMTIGAPRFIWIRGNDLTKFFGPEIMDNEEFKKNFTAV